MMIYLIYAVSILVVFALVADMLSIWFPGRLEKIKRRLYPRGSRRSIDETDATARGVREAALYIANYSLGAGKSAAESVEDAIAYIRSRTKDWKNEEELRQWLVAQLGTHSTRRLPELSIMKTSKPMRDRIIVVSIGFIAGICFGALSAHYLIRSDDYTIQIMNQRTALKINKRTGETWEFDPRQQTWIPISGGR